MRDGHSDDRRGRNGEGPDVDEPAPGENRADDVPVGRLFERSEHVRHGSRRRLDPVGPQLVEQS
jgi:hypothetical protein